MNFGLVYCFIVLLCLSSSLALRDISHTLPCLCWKCR